MVPSSKDSLLLRWRRHWLRNAAAAIFFLAAVATIVGTVAALLSRENPTPPVIHFESNFIDRGQQFDLTIENSGSLDELILDNENGRFPLPFVRKDGSRASVTVPDEVPPGKYDLQVVTSDGQIIETTEKLVVGERIPGTEPIEVLSSPSSTPQSEPEGESEPSHTVQSPIQTDPRSESDSQPTLGSPSVSKLASGSTVQGIIEFPGQSHAYEFVAERNDTVIIALREGTAKSYIRLDVFDSQGDQLGGCAIGYVDTSGGCREPFKRKLEEAGKYTVRVRHSDLATGSYTLSFYQSSVGGGNSITPNSYTRGNIEIPGELHWFSFVGNSGDNILFVLQEGEDKQDLSMELFELQTLDVYGRIWSREVNTNGDQIKAELDVKLQSSGQFVVRISSASLVESSYSLTFNQITF